MTGSQDSDHSSRSSPPARRNEQAPPSSHTRSQSSPDDRTAEVRIPPSSSGKADAQPAPHGEVKPSETPWWVNVNREVSMPRLNPAARVRPAMQRPQVRGSPGSPRSPDHRRPPAPLPAEKASARDNLGAGEPQAASDPRYGRHPGQRKVRPLYRSVGPRSSVPQKRSRFKILIVVGVVVVVVEAVGLAVGLSKLGLAEDKVLDVSKAQAGVQQILVDPTDGYGAANIAIIVCNNGKNPVVRKGATFTCEVIVNGRKRVVTAVFQDDDGTYEVDRPR